MKGVGVCLLVSLMLVLLAIKDTESVSLIDRFFLFEAIIRLNVYIIHTDFGLSFTRTEKDEPRWTEEVHQELEEALQQEERHPQRYFSMLLFSIFKDDCGIWSDFFKRGRDSLRDLWTHLVMQTFDDDSMGNVIEINASFFDLRFNVIRQFW